MAQRSVGRQSFVVEFGQHKFRVITRFVCIARNTLECSETRFSIVAWLCTYTFHDFQFELEIGLYVSYAKRGESVVTMDVIVFQNGTISGTYGDPREKVFFYLYRFYFLLSITYGIVLRAFQQFCTCDIAVHTIRSIYHPVYSGYVYHFGRS